MVNGLAACIGVIMNKAFIGTDTFCGRHTRPPWQDCTAHENNNIHERIL